METYAPKLLKLVEKQDPILHRPAQPVSFPLSLEDQQHVADMKYSILPEQLAAANAPWDSAAGMSANQWGIDRRIFLCREGEGYKVPSFRCN